MSEFILVSYGAGVNSTAILVGMYQREIMPDLILFADTGGERPHTYDYIDMFSEWLADRGMPKITIVKKGGIQETLEENLLRMNHLPALAYGYKQCSLKYKIQPQNKYCNNHAGCKEVWNSGYRVHKYIGYDIGESHRIKNYDDEKYLVKYPLVSWGWDRDKCIDVICKAYLPQPGKSSCFFCPAMKPTEIKQMNQIYPDLVKRAIAIEENAKTDAVVGLGRSFKWSNVIAQGDLFSDKYEQYSDFGDTCGCYDG